MDSLQSGGGQLEPRFGSKRDRVRQDRAQFVSYQLLDLARGDA